MSAEETPKHRNLRAKLTPHQASEVAPWFDALAGVSTGLRIALGAALATSMTYFLYTGDRDNVLPDEPNVVATFASTSVIQNLNLADAQAPETVKDVTP